MKNVVFIFMVLVIISCTTAHPDKDDSSYEVTDAVGRKVFIPDTPKKIVALRAGALRLISYLDATDKIIAVEGNEKKRDVPYLYAHPELKELPVIGSGNIEEPELLAACHPDLIIATYLSKGEASELQLKTGIPVVVVDYGDFNDHMDNFFESLQFLGRLLNREKRADSLIQYILTNIEELNNRSRLRSERQKKKVYIGGIAYRGAHGINSTEPLYAPFRLINVKNVASGMGEVTSSPKAWMENAFIDIEQLIKWNPDIIFLDAAGRLLWEDDLQKESLKLSLNAIQNNELYTVLPHNWYSINYENILCNAWYSGKILYPGQFNDISIRNKSNEIYSMFLGKPIYDSMMSKFNAYGYKEKESAMLNDLTAKIKH